MMDSHSHSGSRTQKTAAAGQLNFGGRGGDFSPIGDIGGQQILVFSGERIDAIQIGETKYGGGGGQVTASARIPADGKIYLLELQVQWNVLCYIRAKIGETELIAGKSDHGDAVILNLPSDFAVRFAGISHGSAVDRLFFNMVS